jgi:ribonuclease HI
MNYKKIIVYSDGGSRGNPGPAGVGVLLYDNDGNLIESRAEYIGKQTNNQAEYHALILGLVEARSYGAEEVSCYLDSELVAKQMKGEYKVKNANVLPLHSVAKNLVKNFKEVKFFNVPRREIEEADKLVNKAINRAMEVIS